MPCTPPQETVSRALNAHFRHHQDDVIFAAASSINQGLIFSVFAKFPQFPTLFSTRDPCGSMNNAGP